MNLNVGKFFNKISAKQRQERSTDSVLADDIPLSELEFVDNISNIQRDELKFVDESDENIDANPFLYSLENLTPDDIPLSKEQQKKTFSQKLSNSLRIIMMFISAGIFVVCSIMLVENLIEKQKANDLYTSLASEFNFSALDGSNSIPEDYNSAILLSPPSNQGDTLLDITQKMLATEEEQPDLGQKIEVKVRNEEVVSAKGMLNSLALKNPDTYGWIRIDGTTIDYPIVQGTDNDYYLNHSFDGSSLVVGSIYADHRSNKNILKNYNTVFYGHNITNGTMFNHVTKFLKEDVFNNTKIVIYTFDGKYIYEPFAIFETRNDYQYFRMEFTSGEDFIKFAEEMQANSKFNKNLTFTEKDRMITLSTCTNGASWGRYCLQARLVEIVK